MKIGYVVPGGVDESGTHRVIPHLVERLGKLALRHRVYVVALRQEPRPRDWVLHGVRVHNVGARPRWMRAAAALRREHLREPFDVLHGVFVAATGPVTGPVGRGLGVPVVAESPGGDFVSLPEIGYGGHRRVRDRVRAALGARMCDALLVPSEPARLAARRAGLDAQRIPWGVDLRAWPPVPPRPRAPSEPLRACWIASLNEVKDPWTMVRVASLLRERGVDAHIDVLGEDVLDGVVQRAVAAVGLEGRVRFHGYVPPAEVRAALEGAHVLLLTSRFEGGARVVLEAAVTGVPTVGTDVGYVSEFAPTAAVAVGVGDSEGLARSLEELARDDGRRCGLAERAQERAIRDDVEETVTRLEALYGELRGAGRP